MIVKNDPKKKQPIGYGQKSNLPSFPRCKRNNWAKFTNGYICITPECELFFNKQKHQNDKKFLIQD